MIMNLNQVVGIEFELGCKQPGIEAHPKDDSGRHLTPKGVS